VFSVFLASADIYDFPNYYHFLAFFPSFRKYHLAGGQWAPFSEVWSMPGSNFHLRHCTYRDGIMHKTMLLQNTLCY